MLLDPPPVPLEIYSDAAIQASIATLEASEAYTEIFMLEHQPEEDAAHAPARDHNDRAGAELKNQTTTVQNVIEDKAPAEYKALAGLDTSVNQLYCQSDQRYLNRLFQYTSENGDIQSSILNKEAVASTTTLGEPWIHHWNGVILILGARWLLTLSDMSSFCFPS